MGFEKMFSKLISPLIRKTNLFVVRSIEVISLLTLSFISSTLAELYISDSAFYVTYITAILSLFCLWPLRYSVSFSRFETRKE